MRRGVGSFDPFAGAPRLHGARRVGCRPGTELIHPIAVTGARPLRWNVDGLPDGLAVDGDGIIRGVAPPEPGTATVRVRVENGEGAIDETIELCFGDTLALTPPMGWNSWNVYGKEVTAEVVMRMGDAMVASGMRDLGYEYINIDDHWHAAERGPDGRPQANPVTFPDGIAAVADHLHALGLKLGIYSDAAQLTCGGCFGGYGYEQVDAATYAEWGVDLLKYDYCYAPVKRSAATDRYGAMSQGDCSLRSIDRLERVRMGVPQAVAVGAGPGRFVLANHTGHLRLIQLGAGRRSRASPGATSGSTATPDPDSGTTPTCCWSATGAKATAPA